MTYPTITTLPSAPQRTQTPDAFSTTADAFVAALPTLVTEVNTAGDYIENKTISVGNDFQGTYAGGTTYTKGQSVLYSSKFYLSLVDSNTGNTPDSSPSQWVEIVGAVTAAAGGTNTFTSDGSITAGDPVGLNSDGTVSTVASLGLSEVEFDVGQIYYASTAYDTTNNKVVIAYRDFGNSNYGTAVVGTVTAGTISFGTPVVFESAETNFTHMTFDPDQGKVVIIYQDSGNSNYATAIVGTVSGTSISFGSAVVFGGTSTLDGSADITYDTTNDKVVISYKDSSNSNYGTAIVGTVSGTSISFGTKVVFQSAISYGNRITFDSNAGKVVICYKDTTASNNGAAVVGTVSGTSISFGSSAVISTGSSGFEDSSVTFDSNSNKVVAAYRHAGETEGQAAVGTVSGTSISFGTPVAFLDTAAAYCSDGLTFNTTSNKVGLVYSTGSGGGPMSFIEGTVSGTTITFGGALSLNSNGNYRGITYDPDTDQYVIAYQDGDSGADNRGAAQVYNAGSTLANWIGFATETVSDATETTITTIGGINESQTSLTVASTYYLQNDGTLSTTITTGREVGKATAATKLYVTQGSISL